MIDITLHYLNHEIQRLGPIVITREFIIYRDNLRDKFNDYGRTLDEKTKCADGLIVEWILIKNNLVEAAKNIKYDFYINKMRIDNKMIGEDANTVTIPNRKEDWMKDAVVSGNLTHFAISKWTSRPEECKGKDGRALQVGDVVTFEILNILSARESLRNLQHSIHYVDSKYFWIN
jgi:hypothetical protein